MSSNAKIVVEFIVGLQYQYSSSLYFDKSDKSDRSREREIWQKAPTFEVWISQDSILHKRQVFQQRTYKNFPSLQKLSGRDQWCRCVEIFLSLTTDCCCCCWTSLGLKKGNKISSQLFYLCFPSINEYKPCFDTALFLKKSLVQTSAISEKG